MPTPDELAAQIREYAAELADQVAALDDEPTTEPPVGGVPAKPTGLACVIGADGKPVLTWDDPGGVASWDVLDLANPGQPVKETVTMPRSVRSPVKPGTPARRYAVRARNAAGESEPSDSVDVPATGGTKPTPPVPPTSGGVDLSQWKLTIPEVKDGKVVEIRPPALARYSDRYFAQVDGGVRFRCWHGGGTTPGSSNPRSELRERVGDDPEGYWNAGKGRHSLRVEGQVNRLTKVTPHTVVLQFHDRKNDVFVFRLEGSKLWITDFNKTNAFLVDGAYQLGTRYVLEAVIENGTVTFAYNSARLDYSKPVTGEGYWKCGNYLQSNPTTAKGESTDEYAEVLLRSVTVTHTP